MSILPNARQDQVIFCENHYPIWEVAPTSIGTTALAVGGLKTATISARTKFNVAQTARQASKNATLDFYNTCGDMRTKAAQIIAAIKAFAEQQADPEAIYVAAHIDPPAPPSPATAPGTPNMVSVTLETTGVITLSWECENAAAGTGAWFNVSRKLPGQTSYTLIGGSPGATAQSRRMSFTDFTIPTSAAGAGAQYIIQGRRGNLVGDSSDAITVQFGVEGGGGGGGGMFAVNGVSQAMKMAA
ncbi:MAG: hypothetical protein IT438_16695 [Phycisphaerales bacterium]|nr:hypothetical protein [Phycisphaerales bacterium]